MKFNMDFFKNKINQENDFEVVKQYIENNINDVERNTSPNYETEFVDKITDKELYHLSTQSQNIINWFPFTKEMEVLELCGNYGEITGTLCDKCKNVITIEPNIEKARLLGKRHQQRENLEVVVGNLHDIRLEKKFDIITLIGVIPYIKELMGKDVKLIELIRYLERFLSEDGKFVLAVDNKFGLRYFSGHPENILNEQFESLIGYSNKVEKIETFTKKSLQNMINDLGYNAKFYYPLPDYRLPNVIFTDSEPAKYNSVDKYVPYSTLKSNTVFNEIDVFREILKTDNQMFDFFANSFLVELSKKEISQIYKYISFNNLRKQDYRLITKISDTFVEKQVVSKEANNHYEQIKENINILMENKINTVDYIENDVIKSKYVEQKYLLNNVLTRLLRTK